MVTSNSLSHKELDVFAKIGVHGRDVRHEMVYRQDGFRIVFSKFSTV